MRRFSVNGVRSCRRSPNVPRRGSLGLPRPGRVSRPGGLGRNARGHRRRCRRHHRAHRAKRPDGGQRAHRALGSTGACSRRRGFRRRNAAFLTRARPLRVSAAGGPVLEPVGRQLQRVHAQGRPDQPLRARSRLGQDHHAGRHVRCDRAARDDAPRRRGVLALRDDVQLPGLVRTRGPRPSSARKRTRNIARKATRWTAWRAIRSQHATIELVQFTAGR